MSVSYWFVHLSHSECQLGTAPRHQCSENPAARGPWRESPGDSDPRLP